MKWLVGLLIGTAGFGWYVKVKLDNELGPTPKTLVDRFWE